MGLLDIRGLSTRLASEAGWVHALDDLSLAIEKGQTFALVGESGCGKSTIAMACLGLLPPNATVQGSVVFDGDSLSYGELNRRANRLAHRLVTLGVGAEVRVGIAVERTLDMVVGLLAIMAAFTPCPQRGTRALPGQGEPQVRERDRERCIARGRRGGEWRRPCARAGRPYCHPASRRQHVRRSAR